MQWKWVATTAHVTVERSGAVWTSGVQKLNVHFNIDHCSALVLRLLILMGIA